MERRSEAGTVGAGGKYETANIPSELRFERAKALVVCDGFHRYMDIISKEILVLDFLSYANGWYNELVGAFRPVSHGRKHLYLYLGG